MRFACLCFLLIACTSNMQVGDDDGGGDDTSSVLGFTASNLDADSLDFSGVGDVVVSGGKTWQTDLGGLLGSSNSAAYNYQEIHQAGGGLTLGVFTVNSLVLDADARVHVRGADALVIVALDSIEIDGVIDANSQFAGAYVGAGAASDSTSPADGLGGGGGKTGDHVTSAGGAGFCGAGGAGGTPSGTPAAGGSPYGSPALSPLVAGSEGGAGTLGAGGAGGGAVQLVAANRITVTGTIHLGGEGGTGSGVFGSGLSQTASGGGSGGALLLEAATISMSGMIAANGGGGGGDDYGGDATPDATPAPGGLSMSAQNAPGAEGSAGTVIDGAVGPSAANANGGGGGGAAGRIRFNTLTHPATITGMMSPAATTPCVSLGTVAP
jgi:hypothetical protein